MSGGIPESKLGLREGTYHRETAPAGCERLSPLREIPEEFGPDAQSGLTRRRGETPPSGTCYALPVSQCSPMA
jgi:hypothetical protein